MRRIVRSKSVPSTKNVSNYDVLLTTPEYTISLCNDRRFHTKADAMKFARRMAVRERWYSRSTLMCVGENTITLKNPFRQYRVV